jgi:L-threonylcarbamoyladenylate synthase
MPSSFKTGVAANLLHAGAVIAYPTEAVWGLGCDPDDVEAVARLLRLKQRDPAKGLILVAASMQQFDDYLSGLAPEQLATLANSWPGPYTWLVPDNGRAPEWIRGEHDKVALRVSAHPLVKQLCRAFGGPIVSSSANISSRPALRRSWQVRAAFGERLDACLEGPLGGSANPSEIRDLVSGQLIRAS